MLDIFHQAGDHAKQLERMHLLDARIRKGEKPSAGKLARHFGVSTKRILRDLERLRRDFGAPLEFDESNKGWFYTEKGFSLSLQFVGKDDLQALYVLGQAVAQYENTPLGGLHDRGLPARDVVVQR